MFEKQNKLTEINKLHIYYIQPSFNNLLKQYNDNNNNLITFSPTEGFSIKLISANARKTSPLRNTFLINSVDGLWTFQLLSYTTKKYYYCNYLCLINLRIYQCITGGFPERKSNEELNNKSPYHVISDLDICSLGNNSFSFNRNMHSLYSIKNMSSGSHTKFRCRIFGRIIAY